MHQCIFLIILKDMNEGKKMYRDNTLVFILLWVSTKIRLETAQLGNIFNKVLRKSLLAKVLNLL